MSTELKKLTVDASNGSFTFEVVDAEARAKADAAKTAAEGIKLPTALPNPKKLTFTGGATGTYDGSSDVTIAIPTGGTGQNPTGGGMSSDASALLITILKSAGYKTDQTANIIALEELLKTSSDSTVTVTSISAVFTQGNNVIYTTDSLASLRANLVVTAKHSDGTEKTVNGYTLSGTLTEGTSTITVSYVGKTTTFICTVTEPTTDTGNLDNITIDSEVMTINAIANAVISDGVMTVA